MISIRTLVIILLSLSGISAFAQDDDSGYPEISGFSLFMDCTVTSPGGEQTVFEESFETDGQGVRYTSDPEWQDTGEDYFGRFSNAQTDRAYTGIDGTYWFGGQDHDDPESPLVVPELALYLSNITISGYTALRVEALFAEQTGEAGAPDLSNYIHMDARIDAGTWQPLLWFETTNTNGELIEDLDFDTYGDPSGRHLSTMFQSFTNTLSTGSTLDLRILAHMDAGDEDWAVDRIRVIGTSTSGVGTGLSGCLATNILTDAQFAAGGWSVTGMVRDTGSGINVNGTNTTGDNISPYLAIAGAGGRAVSNAAFTLAPADGEAISFEPVGFLNNGPAANPAYIALGTHTLLVSVADNDEDTNGDRRILMNAPAGTFLVIDDDTAGPETGSSGPPAWTHVWNRPDQNGGNAPGEDFAIRDALLSRINQLGSGHQGFLSTFSFSGGNSSNGAAGLYLDAMSNALARGASVTFIGDSSISTGTMYGVNSLASLAAGSGLQLRMEQDPFGILHSKLGVFDYGPSGKVVFVSSENFTGAGSFQWNGALDIESEPLHGIFMMEMTNFLAHRFHDDPAKSHAPNGRSFPLEGSWGSNTVRFAPYADDLPGGQNTRAEIVQLIGGADEAIYIAINIFTDHDVADALIAAADANPSLEIHIVQAEWSTTNTSGSKEIYDKLTTPANYAGTNIAHYHTVFESGTQSSIDLGDAGENLIHHKYMVIDPQGNQPIVVHGSANWTYSALADVDANDETTLILRHGGIAASIFENWKFMTGLFSNRVGKAPASGVYIESASGIGTVQVASLLSGSGYTVTGLVRDADSGINVNGTSITQPDHSPYFILVDPTGTHRATNVFATSFTDGGATTFSGLSNLALAAVSPAPTGTWTLLTVVSDNDEDRPGDRTTVTSSIPFTVIGGSGDRDGDGLSDDEETSFGSDPDLPDTDGDGVGDLQEWIAGTGPSNGLDYLRFTLTDGAVSQGRKRMDWATVTGRVYKIYQADAFAQPYSNVYQVQGSGAALSYTNASSNSACFRVEVQIP